MRVEHIIAILITLFTVAKYIHCVFYTNGYKKFNQRAKRYGRYTRIKFKMFLNLFNLNSERIEFDYSFCSYNRENYLYFSFIDYIRFVFFVASFVEENEIDVKQNESALENKVLKNILETAQKDIDEMRELSTKEITQSKIEMEKIANGMKNRTKVTKTR